MVRNGLFGLGAVLTLAGVAAADGPIKSLVEGREPSPVVREFYATEPPTFGYGSGPVASEQVATGSVGLLLVGVVWDVMFNQLTVPLGNASMLD